MGSRILKRQFITKFGDFVLTTNCYRLSKNYCPHMFFNPVRISDEEISELESNSNIFIKAASS